MVRSDRSGTCDTTWEHRLVTLENMLFSIIGLQCIRYDGQALFSRGHLPKGRHFEGRICFEVDTLIEGGHLQI
jgi:hypothetical protein